MMNVVRSSLSICHSVIHLKFWIDFIFCLFFFLFNIVILIAIFYGIYWIHIFYFRCISYLLAIFSACFFFIQLVCIELKFSISSFPFKFSIIWLFVVIWFHHSLTFGYQEVKLLYGRQKSEIAYFSLWTNTYVCPKNDTWFEYIQKPPSDWDTSFNNNSMQWLKEMRFVKKNLNV